MEMQAFLGIPQTGILDEETIRTMNMSRCGNPDKVRKTLLEKFTFGLTVHLFDLGKGK